MNAQRGQEESRVGFEKLVGPLERSEGFFFSVQRTLFVLIPLTRRIIL